MSMAPGANLATRIASEQERLTRRLIDAARHARKHSDDEALHDVRVAARRLEAALDVWCDALPTKPSRRARRALMRLRSKLGVARESQVALGLFVPLVRSLAPEARAAAAPVLARWSERSRRLVRRAGKRCSKRTLKRIERRLARSWAGNGTRAISDAARLAAARVRLESRADRARSVWSAARTSGEDEALHRLRVRIKRWRYAAESLASAGDELPATQREWFRGVQEILGTLHDLSELTRRLKRAKVPALRSLSGRVAAEWRDQLEALRRFEDPPVGVRRVVVLPTPAETREGNTNLG